MKTLFIRGLIVAVVISGVAVVVMLVRSTGLEPLPLPEGPTHPFAFDELGAPERLAGALRIATISGDPTEHPASDASSTSIEAGGSTGEAGDPWLAFRSHLLESFPLVHEALEVETVSERSLLYRWIGSDPGLEPILLTAHADVSEVEDAEAWARPPFAGTIDGGYVWGRGAIDSKGPLIGMLEAAEGLLEAGYVPRRTVLFAFGHDGEGEGAGALETAAVLRERGWRPAWVLGEGLYLVSGMIPGLRDPVGMVGVSEKGRMGVRISARSDPGSRSIPGRATAAGILSQALSRLEGEAFPPEIRGPVEDLLATLGPHMDPGTRLQVSNLWLLGGPLARALTESPLLNASLRSTLAIVAVEAEARGERLPAEASALIEVSVAPWDAEDSVLERLRSVVADLDVEVDLAASVGAVAPTSPSPTESQGFQLVREAIHRSFPDVVGVVPVLSPRATDLRRFRALTDGVFGFSPFRVDRETLQSIGGPEERVRMSVYLQAIRFYAELIRRGSE